MTDYYKDLNYRLQSLAPLFLATLLTTESGLFRQMQSGLRRFAVTARLFALNTDRLRYPEPQKA